MLIPLIFSIIFSVILTILAPLNVYGNTLPKINSIKFTNKNLVNGESPIIELKASGSSKVQYSIFQYSPSKKKYENVSGGYSSPVSSSSPYKLKLKCKLYSGENNFVVWIKRPNTKPANKTGYDTREHYTIKTPTSETAKINQVTINQIDEAVGVTPIIGVKSSSKTKVQYKIQLYSSTLNIWEDASNGYCAPVEASSLTKISTLIPLKPGKNTYKVYVKPHGIQSSESSITKDVVVDSTLTKIDFCAINPFKIKVGNTPEVDIVTSSTEKSIQYRIFSYSYTLNKWDEIMAYSSEYPSSKELTLPLNTTVKKGKNKYLIWAKSSLVEGNGYEDFKIIEFDSESETGPIPPPPNGNTLIVIDPGHGGYDPGAKSNIINFFEKDITLQVALKLGSELERLGYRVLYTRNNDSTAWNSKDKSESLRYRYTFANNNNADLFISLHCNSFNGKGTGIETYFSNSNQLKDREFASLVHKEVINSTSMIDRKAKPKDFWVVTYTKMPALLLEMGFIDNINDAPKLASPEFQNNIVKGIIKGVKSYKQP